MRKWATSGRVKIERANEHIADFEREFAAFRDSRPYRVVRQADSDNHPGSMLVTIQAEPVPIRFSTITADCIHNLHVALDHLWQRVTLGPGSRKKNYFPAYPDTDRAESRFGGKEKGLVKVAVDILHTTNAFDKGNPFWAIREFDDADKHDTLLLLACQLEGDGWESHLKLGIPPGQHRRVLEDGTPLYLLFSELNLEVDMDAPLAFEIAFGKAEVFQGGAVLPTLKHLSKAVDGLASVFERAGLLSN